MAEFKLYLQTKNYGRRWQGTQQKNVETPRSTLLKWRRDFSLVKVIYEFTRKFGIALTNNQVRMKEMTFMLTWKRVFQLWPVDQHILALYMMVMGPDLMGTQMKVSQACEGI